MERVGWYPGTLVGVSVFDRVSMESHPGRSHRSTDGVFSQIPRVSLILNEPVLHSSRNLYKYEKVSHYHIRLRPDSQILITRHTLTCVDK